MEYLLDSNDIIKRILKSLNFIDACEVYTNCEDNFEKDLKFCYKINKDALIDNASWLTESDFYENLVKLIANSFANEIDNSILFSLGKFTSSTSEAQLKWNDEDCKIAEDVKKGIDISYNFNRWYVYYPTKLYAYIRSPRLINKTSVRLIKSDEPGITWVGCIPLNRAECSFIIRDKPLKLYISNCNLEDDIETISIHIRIEPSFKHIKFENGEFTTYNDPFIHKITGVC